jgi:hypothetical protein
VTERRDENRRRGGGLGRGARTLAKLHSSRRVGVFVAVALAGSLAGAQPDWQIVDRNGVPQWDLDPENPEDVFTFVRLRFSSWSRRGRAWATDWPDADLNFSYRLQQLTSMKVAPDPKVLDITDSALFDHPFVYMAEPGALELSDEEVKALRRYLLSGGFMMIDDFWGEREWQNFYDEMKRVFPDREPIELDVSHPIFSAVFPLKEKPQVPSMHHWQWTGRSYERHDGQEPHYRAWFDDQNRMMAIACHNTDLGDGWEREGEDPSYFKVFSEPKSYPMGINIIFYAMTH